MSRTDNLSAEFKAAVAKHEMKIISDNKELRHMTFRNPADPAYHFAITTWPGYLCISGDMGTYVFARIVNMFDFFRTDGMRINSGYWHEKLQSVDVPCGSSVFSEAVFIKEINEHVATWEFTDEEEKAAVMEQLQDEVLCCGCDGETRAYDAAERFRSEYGHEFSDFWEADLQVYTYQYLWCCHAIVWAIMQYDIEKDAAKVCQHDFERGICKLCGAKTGYLDMEVLDDGV